MTAGPTTTPTRPATDEPDLPFDPRRLALRVGAFVAVAAVGILALATLPGVGEVRDRFDAADWHWMGVAAACSLASMLGFVAALLGAFDRVVPFRVAVDLGFAEQGTNVLLPAGGAGGPAFGTFVMRRAGVPAQLAAERHVALFLVTSLVSFVALVLAGTAVWTGLLDGEGVHAVGSILPAAFGAVVLAAALGFARAGAPAPTPPAGRLRVLVWRLRGFLHGGVRTSMDLVRRGDLLLIAGAVAYYAADVAALAAAFHAFGDDTPPVGVFVLAYTLGHAGALIPTPGGVGGTDGGLIGMFVLYGAPLGLATAAVLGYRVFQLGLPVVLGAVSLLRIRHRLRHGPSREQVAARFAELDVRSVTH
ncbi:lysylphosphatidylglycerol synthase domain-containing protein [Conexibacter sp. SYSU D00693]|uniref:lysylphosphatidylglycerol synthase domain-containing protein n=1 Tax=Conexibacter sp. SYSU D00693 TaxID=2812560 RepID=UPI00196A23AE|nr:lysylphosphatidylglycerol synthase domain-containing protein [Conexibacter sp. SYSU D00693]